VGAYTIPLGVLRGAKGTCSVSYQCEHGNFPAVFSFGSSRFNVQINAQNGVTTQFESRKRHDVDIIMLIGAGLFKRQHGPAQPRGCHVVGGKG
jgi:hypothetical protein